MISTQDFAQRVWGSLEDIRERLAALETEAKHTSGELRRLEASLQQHAPSHRHPPSGANDAEGHRSEDIVSLHFDRRMLGGGGVIGGLLALTLGLAKAVGWL